jgi:ABC-type phosphate transport system substrate-binding protein
MPLSGSKGLPLTLRGETLCRIVRGNLTRWDDPALEADCPGWSFPSVPIHMLLLRASTGMMEAFTTYCSKVDPGWNIPVSETPAWRLGNYANYTLYVRKTHKDREQREGEREREIELSIAMCDCASDFASLCLCVFLFFSPSA